jgi:hypothetical protein
MSRQTQLVILISVVLVVLCCCSGQVGRSPDGQIPLKLDMQAPSADWLRSRLNEKIHGSQLSLRTGAEAGCAIQGELILVPVETSCEFTIPSAANRTRQLTLVVPGDGSGGDSVTYQLSQVLDNNNPWSVEETLKRGDDPLALDVFRSQERAIALLILQECTLGKDFKSPEEGHVLVCKVAIKP